MKKNISLGIQNKLINIYPLVYKFSRNHSIQLILKLANPDSWPGINNHQVSFFSIICIHIFIASKLFLIATKILRIISLRLIKT